MTVHEIWTRPIYVRLILLSSLRDHCRSGSRGGGGRGVARPSLFCAKFFKTSPKLAKQILVRAPELTSCFKSRNRPCIVGCVAVTGKFHRGEGIRNWVLKPKTENCLLIFSKDGNPSVLNGNFPPLISWILCNL